MPVPVRWTGREDPDPFCFKRIREAGKDVVLVGVGSRIEIWNKAVWNEKNVYDDMEEIAENMEGLGI